ncbi:MAG TPA: cytochrome c [Burkholderiales bacterium]|nr:cytochrome c [Burkholderiales bacterium]
MSYRLLSATGALAVSAFVALPAYSQVKPDTQVRQRQAAMILQGKYFYPIRNMAQGKMPYDAKIVARNVTYLDSLAQMPWDGFTPATKDIKSRSTPAVFSEPAKFKEAADRFMAEAAKLTDIARKGDEAAIRSQILAVDKTCNSCHENYRERQ